jgi:putative FmdB family regulatory protein
MPTYEYRCPEGHDFERFYRKISDAPGEVACPECGKIAERRMSAGAGFSFKGSGFYLTDYGKNAHRSSGSAPKPSDSASSSKEGGGSSSTSSDSGSSSTSSASAESKPAAPKTESKPASTGSTPKSDK